MGNPSLHFISNNDAMTWTFVPECPHPIDRSVFMVLGFWVVLRRKQAFLGESLLCSPGCGAGVGPWLGWLGGRVLEGTGDDASGARSHLGGGPNFSSDGSCWFTVVMWDRQD
mgnify:CR=1 FL=1